MVNATAQSLPMVSGESEVIVVPLTQEALMLLLGPNVISAIFHDPDDSPADAIQRLPAPEAIFGRNNTSNVCFPRAVDGGG